MTEIRNNILESLSKLISGYDKMYKTMNVLKNEYEQEAYHEGNNRRKTNRNTNTNINRNRKQSKHKKTRPNDSNSGATLTASKNDNGSFVLDAVNSKSEFYDDETKARIDKLSYLIPFTVNHLNSSPELDQFVKSEFEDRIKRYQEEYNILIHKRKLINN